LSHHQNSLRSLIPTHPAASPPPHFISIHILLLHHHPGVRSKRSQCAKSSRLSLGRNAAKRLTTLPRCASFRPELSCCSCPPTDYRWFGCFAILFHNDNDNDNGGVPPYPPGALRIRSASRKQPGFATTAFKFTCPPVRQGISPA